MKNFKIWTVHMLIISTFFNLIMIDHAHANFPVVNVNSIGPFDTDGLYYFDDEGTDEDEFTDAEMISCPGCMDPSLVGPLTKQQEDELDQTNGILIQQAFNSYSQHPKIQEMIQKAREHIASNPDRYILRKNGRKKAFCYRAVKEAMRESGVVPTTFIGSTVARNGVKDLAPLGFRNLLDDPNFQNLMKNDPKMAPEGAILVYENAPGARASTAGHIEIKTTPSGVHGYISISESNRPTYGYPVPGVRKLIGILVK